MTFFNPYEFKGTLMFFHIKVPSFLKNRFNYFNGSKAV